MLADKLCFHSARMDLSFILFLSPTVVESIKTADIYSLAVFYDFQDLELHKAFSEKNKKECQQH